MIGLNLRALQISKIYIFLNPNHAFCRLLSSAGPVGTRFFSDISGTKNANSNLIAVFDCRNMFLLICEMALASNKNYGNDIQNKLGK